jgi:hypothetical protein
VWEALWEAVTRQTKYQNYLALDYGSLAVTGLMTARLGESRRRIDPGQTYRYCQKGEAGERKIKGNEKGSGSEDGRE